MQLLDLNAAPEYSSWTWPNLNVFGKLYSFLYVAYLAGILIGRDQEEDASAAYQLAAQEVGQHEPHNHSIQNKTKACDHQRWNNHLRFHKASRHQPNLCNMPVPNAMTCTQVVVVAGCIPAAEVSRYFSFTGYVHSIRTSRVRLCILQILDVQPG